ncbi:50S ribosomal protein L16 [candidate division TA06 bacterium]|jgi:large subunit ribosomal protein L16|uniref:Large ribosomal subunit protein uL16 n=1 Tax=candidate division TA06 bacterium TaxID=2250710 RepID=A0A660SAX7_UNCT6|nr:50S ribosomal protein L16 [candidate division WOR-3 bacterium]RKX67954.1 MAG: 50S ribosomal protein L16 [candidate division TA06 bacterium]
MLMPSRVKYRKQQRGRRKGYSKGALRVDFGDYGLKAMETAWINSRQIESCRVAINRAIGKNGKIWIRIFPDKPFTKKPAETRMGKGKGAPDHWVAVVKRGRVMFEVSGAPIDKVKRAFKVAGSKLPIRTKLVEREKVS